MNIVIWWHNTTCGGSWYLCSWVHSAMNYHILKLSSLEVFFCFFLPSTIYQDQKSVWYWLIADCGLRIVDCTSIVHLARLLSLLKNEWVMIWFSILSSHHMTNLALRQYFVRATTRHEVFFKLSNHDGHSPPSKNTHHRSIINNGYHHIQKTATLSIYVHQQRRGQQISYGTTLHYTFNNQ